MEHQPGHMSHSRPIKYHLRTEMIHSVPKRPVCPNTPATTGTEWNTTGHFFR